MGGHIPRISRKVAWATCAWLLGACAGAELRADNFRPRQAERSEWTRASKHTVAAASPAPSVIAGFVLGDTDGDGDVDWREHAQFVACLAAGGPQVAVPAECLPHDFGGDMDVDLRDWAIFSRQFAPIPAVPNSSCFLPAPAMDGSQPVNSLGATTDGPDEPTLCEYYGLTQVESDIWFCYQATCTGEAVISLCGSNFDTKMAVYAGCQCPDADSAIACSDDDCGSAPQNLQSRVAVNVVAGQSYMIRIGGFAGQQGEGALNISCGTGDPCTGSATDCLEESPDESGGCADTACCQATCDVDRYCCDVLWDAYCAAEAEGLCDGSFEACETADTSCTFASLQPGCDDSVCCNSVCGRDPYCCIVEWDVDCVEGANGYCGLTCGSRAESCFSPHASPGCDNVACCQQVCPADPFCCSTEWDENCVAAAQNSCN